MRLKAVEVLIAVMHSKYETDGWEFENEGSLSFACISPSSIFGKQQLNASRLWREPLITEASVTKGRYKIRCLSPSLRRKSNLEMMWAGLHNSTVTSTPNKREVRTVH